MTGSFKGTKRYQVIRPLGSGGTGNVYLVHDRRRGHQVALKTLRSDSPYGILRFKNEFRGLSELAHENLINLYEFHHENEQWFFTMEYIEGEEFIEWVRPYNLLLGEREVDHLRLSSAIEQLVKGVSTLHLTGHLHRDIKPSNVLIDHSGRLTILDYGLATKVENTEDREVRGISGTLEYMAPEQTDGRQATRAADWYSVGVLIYQALTGRLPFEGQPLKIALDKRLSDGPNPRQIAPNIPVLLADLCEDLLKCEPENRLDEAEIMHRLNIENDASLSLSIGTTSSAMDAPLVGREKHLSILVGAYMLHRDQGAHLVLLHGASGMGKSSLIDSFLEPIRERNEALILRGRCFQRESLAFRAFDQIIDGLARYLSRQTPHFVESVLPAGASSLATLFPVMQNVQGFAKRLSRRLPPSDPNEIRSQAFQSVKDLLADLSVATRIIICVDDAHHADLASLALLRTLLDEAAPKFFMLISYHGDLNENTPFLANLQEDLASQRFSVEYEYVEVGALAHRDSVSLAKQHVQTKDAPIELFEQIASEAGGNPFFIKLLSASLDKAILESQGEPQLDTESVLGLTHLFRQRIHQLPKAARRLLAIVAVSDEMLPLQVACTAASLGKDGRWATTRLESELLIRNRRLNDVDYCEIYHERIRQAVLSELNGKNIDKLNQELSKALTVHGEALNQSLFDHYLGEQAFDKARDFALEGGRRAASQFAFERAAHLFEQALELHVDSMTFPPSENAEAIRGEITMALADALAANGLAAQAARILLDAANKAEGADSVSLRQRAAALFLSSGHFDEGLRAAYSALEHHSIEISLFGEHESAAELPGYELSELVSRDVDFRSKATSELKIRFELLWVLASRLFQTSPKRAMLFHQKLTHEVWQHTAPKYVARTLALEACFQALNNQATEAQTLALSKRSFDIGNELNDSYSMGIARFSAGIAHFYYGRWGLSSHFLSDAERIFKDECTGAVWETSSAQAYLISALAAQGEFNDLMRRVPTLLARAISQGNRYLAGQLRTGYSSLVWLCADDPESATRHIDDAITEWNHEGYTILEFMAMLARVHIHLYQGDPEGAWQWLERDAQNPGVTQLREIAFVDLEFRVLRVRTLIALLPIQTKNDEIEGIAMRIKKDLTRLFRTHSPWVIAIAHYLKLIFDRHYQPQAVNQHQIQMAIQALEGTGLHHYARTARIFSGVHQNSTLGAHMMAEGIEMVRRRGVQNPEKFLRIYLPGVELKSASKHAEIARRN